MCGKNCKFCTHSRVIEIAEQLQLQFKILESEGLSLAAKDLATDWIAGDMKSVGWAVARNGVPVDNDMEKLLGHEFQTILLTSKMLKYSPTATWSAIDSNVKLVDDVIPGSYRSYLYEVNTVVKRNSCLKWGKRKMLPYQKDITKCNLAWMASRGLVFIAKFFVSMESSLLNNRMEENDGIFYNYLNLIVRVRDADFSDYKMSGQCVIANFGFVQEQALHMDFVPVKYD